VGKTVKSQKSRTAARNKCDRLFSEVVRSRGHCVRCGSVQFLQCAHIVSRRYLGTRCDYLNALSLCRSCHVYFTHRPLEWEAWVSDFIGEDSYKAIKGRAMSLPTPDWFELLEELKTNVPNQRPLPRRPA
jgi:hypothetical protein